MYEKEESLHLGCPQMGALHNSFFRASQIVFLHDSIGLGQVDLILINHIEVEPLRKN